MKAFLDLLKRYRLFLIIVTINFFILWMYPDIGAKSFILTGQNMLEMLAVIPPIFVLLGLLDVWVKRETMIKYMGEGSGLKGALIGFFLGSAAAGPLYGAFPIAGILLKKGSKLSNVLIFIGAWSTTKIPLLLFESSSMGLKFMLIRFILNLFGIGIIAYLTERMLSKKEVEELYDIADAQNT